jgi:chemotaxis response regulator CheB
VSEPIRLLIADDHPVVRDGLSSMFARDPEFAVLGEAADGAEAVRLALALTPDAKLDVSDRAAAVSEAHHRGLLGR